jgi:hypothetical protein
MWREFYDLKMIAIYSNNLVLDLFIQDLIFSQPYCVYHSIDQYISAPADVHIAFVNHLSSVQVADSEEQRLQQVINGRYFSQEISQVKEVSDQVFAFDNELHSYHITELFAQHCEPNIFWAIPGQINDDTIINRKNVILWNQHFEIIISDYQRINNKLKELDHTLTKPIFFDALLGQPRTHRDFVFNAVHRYKLQEKILTTYLDSDTGTFRKNFLFEPDIEELGTLIDRTVDMVRYHGEIMALSRIVPIQIYNQTAYSIVAETGADNSYSFFTEKTAKCFLARRMFVMFSGFGFLQNLRKIGFRTFDNVIDESYDLITSDYLRWEAAFDQVQKLCEMDQQEVFEKIASITEHNYKLLMNTNWRRYTLDQLQQKLMVQQPQRDINV